jgi:hypothetical protein
VKWWRWDFAAVCKYLLILYCVALIGAKWQGFSIFYGVVILIAFLVLSRVRQSHIWGIRQLLCLTPWTSIGKVKTMDPLEIIIGTDFEWWLIALAIFLVWAFVYTSKKSRRVIPRTCLPDAHLAKAVLPIR